MLSGDRDQHRDRNGKRSVGLTAQLSDRELTNA
jgi:hypothetical protein